MIMHENQVSKNASKSKFAVFSIIGFFLFLVPMPNNGTFTIPVGILIDIVKGAIGDYTLVPMVILVSLNALGTLAAKIVKPKFIMDHKWLRETFDVSMLYAVSRIIGAAII